jgi:hypothetical protein
MPGPQQAPQTQRRAPARARSSNGQKDRPVKVVRIRNIRGNVWGNRLEDGRVVYNVTIDRIWKEDDQTDDSGAVVKIGQWQQSQSFGKDDLLIVAKVADLCHTWIYKTLQDRDQSF